MTFSSVCWAQGQSMLPWETMTPIMSLHLHVLGFPEQFLTRNRAQDAPHSLGGKLAKQFSWSALACPVDINRIHRYFIGTMTTFPGYGNMRSGSLNLRLLRRARIMRHTVCSVLMGYVYLPSILTYVSVSLLGCIELTRRI